ncbi:ATP-binding cassette domain-containing protein, partial [Klebsiella pneumoniae]|nr:ATP-binding cassette domain-containing protein [Klebsiella pneumoniae]
CGLPYDQAKVRLNQAVDDLGIRHLLEQDLMTLSGGEKQRAALAILIAVNPPVFFLDEPFASIDPASRLFLINVLAK